MEHGAKPFLKATFFVLIACIIFGCSSSRKVVSSSAPEADATAAGSLEEDFEQSPVPAEVKPVETKAPANELRAHVWQEARSIEEEDIRQDKQDSGQSPSPVQASAKASKDAQQSLDEALEFCETSQDFWAQGDFENGLAALDQAYSLLLSVDTENDAELSQQKEDIRFMICKRMLEIYASRYTVAAGNHNAIPLVMNEYVERELKLFQTKEKDFFIRAYRRSGRYRPEIIKALREAGIPEELSWLPLIESGFKAKALSPARALGLWQFIPSTGYKYGLKRDQWIDERMDVSKETRAAIDYMRELHSMFGDWMTVLAAYNCGEGRVLRVIRSQNINYLDNFWDLFQKLPYETARYVPRFLATLYIIQDPGKYGMDLGEVEPPESYERVTVEKQMRLKDIAGTMELSDKAVEDLNPELRYKVTPPSSYELKVPRERGRILLARLDRIPSYSPPKSEYGYHQVRRGDTLSKLAARYRTSVRAIASANRIRTNSVIHVGQRLKIPGKGSEAVYVAKTKSSSLDKSKPVKHRVRRGDSLWSLARKHNTNIKEIKRANRLRSNELRVGQVLVIPRGNGAGVTGSLTKTYRVRRGDTPFKIAHNHKMQLNQFLRINDLTPRSKIFPGQMLLVEVR
jgi:membrane-bound lytic murein transglycosylase D